MAGCPQGPESLGRRGTKPEAGQGAGRPDVRGHWTLSLGHCLFLGLSCLFWKMVKNQIPDHVWGAGVLAGAPGGANIANSSQIYQVFARTCLGSGEGRGSGELGQRCFGVAKGLVELSQLVRPSLESWEHRIAEKGGESWEGVQLFLDMWNSWGEGLPLTCHVTLNLKSPLMEARSGLTCTDASGKPLEPWTWPDCGVPRGVPQIPRIPRIVGRKWYPFLGGLG